MSFHGIANELQSIQFQRRTNMEILALAIICGIAFIPTAISDWIANHNGINEIMKKWIIGPLRIRQPTTWDWIFGWIIIVS